MPQFYPLTVTDIQKTTRDAVVVTLIPPGGVDFGFTAGQYLTLRRDFEGQELRRSYSICAGAGDGKLQVGIKQVDGGAFSTWANTELAVGDTVDAMPPMGNFYAPQGDAAPRTLAFAAGSGITPILSILRSELCANTDAQVTLVYANRTPNTIMFREELEDLKNQHMGRLNIIHILSQDAQDIDLFGGRIDGAKCAALFEQWIDVGSFHTAYICGPEDMMQTIASSLETHGMARANIRFELFASSQPGRAKLPAKTTKLDSNGIAGQVTLGGETRAVTIDPATSLLDAALGNALDAPFACKAGVCSTCKAKVLSGEVEMVKNHALEDYEVDAGYVLTCQCYPVTSDKVVWDYDQAGH